MRMMRNGNLELVTGALKNGASAMRLKRAFADAGRAVRLEFAAPHEPSRMRLNRRGQHRPKIHFEQAAEIRKESFVEAARAR
jgi:hypothetical protein